MPESPGRAAVRLLSDRDGFVARLRVRAVQGESIAQEPISTEGRYRHVRAEFLAWDDFNASFLRGCFSDGSVAMAYQSVQLESAGHAPLGQLVEDLHGVILGRIEHLRALVGSLGTAAGPSGSFERVCVMGSEISAGTVDELLRTTRSGDQGAPAVVVSRVDPGQSSSTLTQQGVRQAEEAIRSAHVVVADVTLAAPVVMWGLGFAHALGKPTVVVRNGSTAALDQEVEDLTTSR